MDHGFGKIVRKARKGRGLRVRTLAQRAGVSAGFLSRVERGKLAPPSEQTIRALAAELGEDPLYLLSLAGRIPRGIMDRVSRYPKEMGELFQQILSISDDDPSTFAAQIRGFKERLQASTSNRGEADQEDPNASLDQPARTRSAYSLAEIVDRLGRKLDAFEKAQNSTIRIYRNQTRAMEGNMEPDQDSELVGAFTVDQLEDTVDNVREILFSEARHGCFRISICSEGDETGSPNISIDHFDLADCPVFYSGKIDPDSENTITDLNAGSQHQGGDEPPNQDEVMRDADIQPDSTE